MDAWLASLSRGTLALLAITGGILFILVNDPPNTVCGAQVNTFYNEQAGYLYPGKGKFEKTPGFEQYSTLCKRGNNSGGCLELFIQTRKLLEDLKTVSRECLPEVSKKAPVKMALFGVLDLMAKSAWGAKPPVTAYDKRGWLDDADISLFCRVMSTSQLIYGDQAINSFQEKYFTELPGVKESRMKREDIWARMLFSISCRNYQ